MGALFFVWSGGPGMSPAWIEFPPAMWLIKTILERMSHQLQPMTGE